MNGELRALKAFGAAVMLSIVGIGAAQADVAGAVYMDDAGNPVIQMQQGDVIIQDASTGEFQPVAAGEMVTVMPGSDAPEYLKTQGELGFIAGLGPVAGGFVIGGIVLGTILIIDQIVEDTTP